MAGWSAGSLRAVGVSEGRVATGVTGSTGGAGAAGHRVQTAEERAVRGLVDRYLDAWWRAPRTAGPGTCAAPAPGSILPPAAPRCRRLSRTRSASCCSARRWSGGWTDEPVATWLAGPAVAGRMEVWKAVGMLVHTLGTTQRRSLELLLGAAARCGGSLDAVAARLTAGELEPADVPSGFPPAVTSLDTGRRQRSG